MEGIKDHGLRTTEDVGIGVLSLVFDALGFIQLYCLFCKPGKGHVAWQFLLGSTPTLTTCFVHLAQQQDVST